jgi:hypothetical protein
MELPPLDQKISSWANWRLLYRFRRDFYIFHLKKTGV